MKFLKIKSNKKMALDLNKMPFYEKCTQIDKIYTFKPILKLFSGNIQFEATTKGNLYFTRGGKCSISESLSYSV